MSTGIIVDIIGWIGAILLLLAYIAISSEKVTGKSFSYQILNAIGSVFLIINSAYYHAYPSAFVNVVWITIAVITIISARKKAH